MYGQVYMCIDTKLFYVYVECVARGYDSFKVPLVVADPARGDGAITLAIRDIYCYHCTRATNLHVII